ncbi:putative membrane protein [plant metagenome]|uniref:Putative membrane protein n=1 Tax=plant metagenome TaxID=1297885 RepID=A0A484T8J9_9ZZZZ
MSARQLLDQLLQSGQSLARQAQQGGGGQGGLGGGLGGALGSLAGLAGGKGGKSEGGGLSSLMSGFGGGALSGGALAMLLSNKKARKLGGKAALYGGMAALGVLAYKAYGNWQSQQSAQAAAGQSQAAPVALPEPQTIDRLPPAQAEQHSSAILVAMIGAAKADGHVGQEETQQLEAELVRLSGDDADRRWLHDELAKPLDPAGVARAAQTPEMAAEMYLASLLVVDEETFMERAYLDELARQLKLEPGLKAELEAQVKAAVVQQ